MYLTPPAMKPDTFSQYGYADATNLRALRRGYGHDIYPQYPTTYNMPRVVAGLGAFTKNNYTIPYYADPGSLSFADKNLKKLYEGLRNADADFQINLFKVKKAIEPAFDGIELVTGGKIKAADIKKALSLKLPTWGVALFLEVAAGKRPLDKGFRAVMQVAADDAAVSTAAFGILAGINTTAAALSVVPPVAPFFLAALPFTGPLATVAGSGTAVCAIVQPIFSALAKGKAPSKKQMKDMMEGAARLSGQKLPSSTEIDKIASDFDKAAKAASAATEAAAKTAADAGNPALASKQEKQQTLPAPANTPADTVPQAQAASGGFPVVPVLLGVGALAAVVLVARKRGKK